MPCGSLKQLKNAICIFSLHECDFDTIPSCSFIAHCESGIIIKLAVSIIGYKLSDRIEISFCIQLKIDRYIARSSIILYMFAYYY